MPKHIRLSTADNKRRNNKRFIICLSVFLLRFCLRTFKILPTRSKYWKLMMRKSRKWQIFFIFLIFKCRNGNYKRGFRGKLLNFICERKSHRIFSKEKLLFFSENRRGVKSFRVLSDKFLLTFMKEKMENKVNEKVISTFSEEILLHCSGESLV